MAAPIGPRSSSNLEVSLAVSGVEGAGPPEALSLRHVSLAGSGGGGAEVGEGRAARRGAPCSDSSFLLLAFEGKIVRGPVR